LTFEAHDLVGDEFRSPGDDSDVARLRLAQALSRVASFSAAYSIVDPLIERARADSNATCAWLSELASARGSFDFIAARYAEAEVDFGEALDLARMDPERDDLLIAGKERDLAAILLTENRLAEADALLVTVREALRRHLGESNVRTIDASNSLALIREYRGQLDDAEKILRECVDGAARVLAPDHPDMLILRMNLGQVWQRQQRFDEAEKLDREIVALSEKRSGGKDPNTLVLLGNLGTCLNVAKKFAEAEEIHRRVFDERTALFGPDHHATLESENNLAFALQAQGRFADALPFQEDVVHRTPEDDPQYVGRKAMLDSIRAALAKSAAK
jgi:tetratricopeptide (TPR) repeat protein